MSGPAREVKPGRRDWLPVTSRGPRLGAARVRWGVGRKKRRKKKSRGQASVYRAAPPTAVTHLTITSLKVNWLLFQQDDNAN